MASARAAAWAAAAVAPGLPRPPAAPPAAHRVPPRARPDRREQPDLRPQQRAPTPTWCGRWRTGLWLEVFTRFHEAPPTLTAPEPGSAAVPGPCLLYTSPSPRDGLLSRMPSS